MSETSSSSPRPPVVRWSAVGADVEPRLGFEDRVVKFINCRLFIRGELHRGDLWLQNGKVISPASRFWQAATFHEYAAQLVVDCEGHILSPGFIDVQFNGAYGVDYSCQELTAEDIHTVNQAITQTGVTSLCPTIVSSSPETYAHVVTTFRAAREGTSASTARIGARNLGLHLEGPFITPERRGAHAEHNLTDVGTAGGVTDARAAMSPQDAVAAMRKIYGPLDLAGGEVRIVTLAPELPHALAAVTGLAASGVVVSIGHTSADIKQADSAISAGATMVTHLFNAMSSFHHRDPGVPGLLGRRKGGAAANRIRREGSVSLSSSHSASSSSALEAGLARLLSEPSEATHPSGIAQPSTESLVWEATPGSSSSRSSTNTSATACHTVSRAATPILQPIWPATANGSTHFSMKTIGGGNLRVCASLSYHSHRQMASTAAALLTHASAAREAVTFRTPVPFTRVRRRQEPLSRPYFGLIVDGVHNHPYAVNFAMSAHPTGLVLVTDAMKAMGLPPGSHTLGELSVDIFHGAEDGHYEGLHAVLAGTTTLAGAVVPLDQCIRNLRTFTGCSIAQALATVTSHPAEVLGLQELLGSLEAGAWGDLVLLNDDLEVLQTYVAGDVAYTRTLPVTKEMNAYSRSGSVSTFPKITPRTGPGIPY